MINNQQENEMRRALENLGDLVEGLARELELMSPARLALARRQLSAYAWDIRQLARRGTTSQGI